MKSSCSRGICGITSLVLTASVILQFSGCGDDGGGVAPPSAELADLTISEGTPFPAFSSDSTLYVVECILPAAITVTPTALDSGATITVDGVAVTSGTPSQAIVLAQGMNTITVLVTATDGVTQMGYTILAFGYGHRTYLKASNTGAGDSFGRSIAIDGDTVVVGACDEGSNATGVDGDQEDSSADGSGAAYVFTRAGGVWSQQAYLKASNTDAGDYFGYSVAVDGDTIVVGAFYEDSIATDVNSVGQADNSGYDSGAAYVFTRSGGVWSQQAYLKASNTGESDGFGCSVAVDGDTVVVGACNEDSSATGVNSLGQADNNAIFSGAAYVFTRTADVWSQQAYLKASNTDVGDLFGLSVAVDGDTVVVGAYGEDSSATGVNSVGQADNSVFISGAAYVFTRSGGVWNQQAYLKASNTGAYDSFGYSVAVDGDTVVVGAYGEDSCATGVNGGGQADNSAGDSGAAYVFTRSGGVWSQQAYLKTSNTGASDWSGLSVAVDGDTVVVGARYEDSNATGVDGDQADNSASDSGATYVFTRSGGAWTQQTYLKASNTEANDGFGCSIAVDGDTIVVGAYWEDSNATGVDGDETDNSALDAGAVYVFE